MSALIFEIEKDFQFEAAHYFWKIEKIISSVIDVLDHSLLNEIDGLEKPALEQIAKWIFLKLDILLDGLICVEVRRESCGEKARVKKQ